MSFLLILLACMLSFVFAANNASLITYGLVRIIRYRRAVLLAGLGLFLGTVMEGYKMGSSIVNGIVPTFEINVMESILLASLVVMIVGTVLKVPTSMTMIFVISAIPTALLVNQPINWSFVSLIFLSWIGGPFLTVLLMLVIRHLTTTIILPKLSILRVSQIQRPIIFTVMFVTAYVLGANNIGLIYSLTTCNEVLFLISGCSLIGIFAFLGAVIFAKGTTETMSYRIVSMSPNDVLSNQFSAVLVMWLLTQIAVPISLTQLLISGAIGVYLTRSLAIVNVTLIKKMMVFWIIASLGGALLSVILLTLI